MQLDGRHLRHHDQARRVVDDQEGRAPDRVLADLLGEQALAALRAVRAGLVGLTITEFEMQMRARGGAPC